MWGRINRNDFASGAFFIAVGLAYGGMALRSLPIGEALNMGPGYFPLVLSGALVLLGGAILVRSFSGGGQSRFGAVPWRALIFLSLATLIFARFLEDLGILPAVFITAFAAALASPQVRWPVAVLTSLGAAGFCTAVFMWGLGLPIPLLGRLFVD